jgi:hypothetical protein
VTNRRVLLWAQKSTTLQSRRTTRLSFGHDPRGPISYYPPHLLDAGLEEDKGSPGVGGIAFKLVKVIIKTQTRDPKSGMTRHHTHTQLHYFGLLHVRNHLGVARLVHDTLIAPCRGL